MDICRGMCLQSVICMLCMLWMYKINVHLCGHEYFYFYVHVRPERDIWCTVLSFSALFFWYNVSLKILFIKNLVQCILIIYRLPLLILPRSITLSLPIQCCFLSLSCLNQGQIVLPKYSWMCELPMEHG